MITTPRRGALVISLDFELDWGVRDTLSLNGGYRENLLGAREVVPKLLALFDRYEIAATWATVGFLFASSREGLLAASPAVKPQYHDVRLDPYRAEIGDDEQSDPLHYAASLVELIAAQPRQELATHTFSHYYCLEPGQTKEVLPRARPDQGGVPGRSGGRRQDRGGTRCEAALDRLPAQSA